MFIQTYCTGGTRPTFLAELSKDAPRGCATRRPAPASFLRSNRHLIPASLARRGRASQPEPTKQTRRGRPEARRRHRVKVAEVWTFGFTGGEVGVERRDGSQAPLLSPNEN